MTALKEFAPKLYLTELLLDDFDVRGALILSDTHAVVWDTLSHPRDMQPVLPLLRDKRLWIVYSHADWDHVWGTAGLPPGEIFAHSEAYARFAADVPQELNAKKLEQPGAWDAVALVPPQMVFSGQLHLDLGGLTLELHHLPGHTRDCLVGFIPQWGVLLAGDTLETPLPVVNEDSPLALWIEGLARWQGDERVKTVIPAHGETGDRQLIARNIAYLRSLIDGREYDDLPAIMSAFYHDTHAKNKIYARRA